MTLAGSISMPHRISSYILATRSGVLTNPSRSRSSPIPSRSIRIAWITFSLSNPYLLHIADIISYRVTQGCRVLIHEFFEAKFKNQDTAPLFGLRKRPSLQGNGLVNPTVLLFPGLAGLLVG